MRPRLGLLLALLFVSSIAPGISLIHDARKAAGPTLKVGYTIYQPSKIFENTWSPIGSSSYTTARAIALDSAGNVYAAGVACCGTPGGSSHFLLLKFSSTGGFLSSRAWDDSGFSYYSSTANGVAVDASDNLYMTGSEYLANGTFIILLKFDSNGSLAWQKRWTGNADAVAAGLALDSTGNIYVTGTANSTSFSSSDRHVFLLKFASNGRLVWQKSWGYLGGSGLGLAVDGQGNVYVSGFSSPPPPVAFLVKFNSTGNLQWQRIWNTNTATNSANAVALDPSGSIWVTGFIGYFNSSFRQGIPLLKFDSSGNILFQRIWTVPGSGNGLAVDPAGNAYLTGGLYSYSYTHGLGILLAKFLPSGSIDWAMAGGTALQDAGNAIGLDSSGKLLVAGFVNNALPSTWISTNTTTIPFNFNPSAPAARVSNLSGNVTDLLGYTSGVMGSSKFLGPWAAYVLKAGPPVPGVPEPPGTLAATQGTDNVTLSWNYPFSDGGSKVLGYRLYKGQSNGSETLYVNLTNARSYIDKSVSSGVTYYYYVTAGNIYGWSIASNKVVVQLSNSNPAIPINLATVGVGVASAAGILVVVLLLRRRSRTLRF